MKKNKSHSGKKTVNSFHVILDEFVWTVRKLYNLVPAVIRFPDWIQLLGNGPKIIGKPT